MCVGLTPPPHPPGVGDDSTGPSVKSQVSVLSTYTSSIFCLQHSDQDQLTPLQRILPLFRTHQREGPFSIFCLPHT